MQIDLFSLQTIQATTVYVFLAIIIFMTLRYLIFASNVNNQGISKIVGGLSVFIVALLSQQPWVILVSLFIGGLIIASEEFMQKLVIILRSESKDIGENLKPVSASAEEIKEKQKQEIQETVEIEDSIQNKKSIKKSTKGYSFGSNLRHVLLFEQQVKQYLVDMFSGYFLTDVKIENPYTNETLVVDGVVLANDKESISFVVEIKVISVVKRTTSIIGQTVQKIKLVRPDLPIMIYLVFIEEVSKRDVLEIKKYADSFDLVSVTLFEVHDERIIPLINL